MRLRAVVVAVATVLIGACSNPQAEAAEGAFDECLSGDGEGIVRVDGATIHIEVIGADARELADALDREVPSEYTEGMTLRGMTEGYENAIFAEFMTECFTDVTNYPGNVEWLKDGDEWEGWRYDEAPAVGAEIRRAFTATG